MGDLPDDQVWSADEFKTFIDSVPPSRKLRLSGLYKDPVTGELMFDKSTVKEIEEK